MLVPLLGPESDLRKTKGGRQTERSGTCHSCFSLPDDLKKFINAPAAIAEDFPSTVKTKVLEMRSRIVDLFGYISQGQDMADGWGPDVAKY